MKRSVWLLAAALLLLVGCSKEEGPRPPQPTEQTLLMYFPWSGNTNTLTSNFLVNIQDMKEALLQVQPEGSRVLVFFMENGTSGRLFELIPDLKQRIVREEPIAVYEELAITTAEEITGILNDVVQAAPARRYGLTIGCHGMGWIPAGSTAARSARLGETEKEHWEYTDEEGRPLTRWFGGNNAKTDIGTLREAIERAGLHLEFILFDDCYMATVEVGYELRNVADHLIGSTCEVMAYGFPYDRIGRYLLGTVDYEAVCEEFYNFYSHYVNPYGTISVTDCGELEALAAIMKEINAVSDPETVNTADLQVFDGYSPDHRFFDLGDYVAHLCTDAALATRFAEQLERVVPARLRRHTECYFSASTPTREYRIETYSGLDVSDPSTSAYTAAKTETAWWKATH